MSSEMAPCPKCRELNAKYSTECLFCGTRLPWAPAGTPAPAAAESDSATTAPVGVQPEPFVYAAATEADGPSPQIALLSFLIPIVGIVLYFRDSATHPLRAKSALKGFLSGISIYFVLYLLLAPGPTPTP